MCCNKTLCLQNCLVNFFFGLEMLVVGIISISHSRKTDFYKQHGSQGFHQDLPTAISPVLIRYNQVLFFFKTYKVTNNYFRYALKFLEVRKNGNSTI